MPKQPPHQRSISSTDTLPVGWFMSVMFPAEGMNPSHRKPSRVQDKPAALYTEPLYQVFTLACIWAHCQQK